MVKGIAIDIAEITRIKRAMDKNSRIVKRILTENEYIHYTTLPTERRKLEYVAGRFAAKEAYAKAAGTGLGKLSLQHIEILSRSEEHTSELQSRFDLVCRLLLEKKKRHTYEDS